MLLPLLTKALLLNAGVVAACVIERHRGYPLGFVVACGAVFFLAANILIFLAAQQERRARGQLSRFAFKDDRDTWKELKR
jgi:hypothetical protein